MKDVIETTTDISLSPDKNKTGNTIIIFKKQEPNGVILCEEYRAGKKELELQTAYRLKKNQQSLSAGNRPLANVRNVTVPIQNNTTDSENVKNETVSSNKYSNTQIGKAVEKYASDVLRPAIFGGSST